MRDSQRGQRWNKLQSLTDQRYKKQTVRRSEVGGHKLFQAQTPSIPTEDKGSIRSVLVRELWEGREHHVAFVAPKRMKMIQILVPHRLLSSSYTLWLYNWNDVLQIYTLSSRFNRYKYLKLIHAPSVCVDSSVWAAAVELRYTDGCFYYSVQHPTSKLKVKSRFYVQEQNPSYNLQFSFSLHLKA